MQKFAVLVGVLLVATVGAYAGPIAGPDFSNPVEVKLLSFNGGLWQNGYPYKLLISGVPFRVNGMCDDYVHGGLPGDIWEANITNLGSDNLTLTRFGFEGSALSLFLYREAAWILLQTPRTPPSEYADMNYAVWHIFDHNAPLDPGAEFWLKAALLEAARGFPGVPFYAVFIITPIDQLDPDPNHPQEFLAIDAQIGGRRGGTTPEPGTLLLLATGLLGLGTRRLLS